MKTYLITGGTGSLGSILCRRIIERGDKVRTISQSESKLAAVKNLYPESKYTGIIGNVKDFARVNFACRDVDYVIHTAAMKDLTITESNVPEMHLTNIGGTDNLMRACIEQGVKKAVFMSSDKAVYPNSAYGASKLSGEYSWRHGANIQDRTAFMILRSGNFKTSAGNVFEVWSRQQAKGETPGITDTKMTRNFIDTEKVADIILQMIGSGNNGDLVVPKMQEYNILDLFKERYPNTKYNIIGLRPGEKLAEVLTYENERMVKETADYRVYRSGK
jgi:FlaA1/EpsC-like NDP-sugar epimerase